MNGCFVNGMMQKIILFGLVLKTELRLAHLYKYNNSTNKFIRIKIPVKGIGSCTFYHSSFKQYLLSSCYRYTAS